MISRFIFPGGELDYIDLTATNLERHGFEVHDVEGMREHYQLTLERWLQRLYENREVAAAEVGKTTMRLWMLYFSFFARAFERGTIGIFQNPRVKARCAGLGASTWRAPAEARPGHSALGDAAPLVMHRLIRDFKKRRFRGRARRQTPVIGTANTFDSNRGFRCRAPWS